MFPFDVWRLQGFRGCTYELVMFPPKDIREPDRRMLTCKGVPDQPHLEAQASSGGRVPRVWNPGVASSLRNVDV